MNRRGFSLPEVMVAVILISIAALGLISVQIFSLRAGVTNRQQYNASVLAASILSERERDNRSYQESFDQLLQVPRTATAQEAYFYALQETSETPQLKRITIDIYYPERGVEHTFTLQTLVYRGG